MTRNSGILFATALIVVSVTVPAKADIAPEPLSGGKNLAIVGEAKTKVAMVDEIVKLLITKDQCFVDVVFTMRNSGQVAETIQVGFPSNYADDMKDFKASVDDVAIAVNSEAVSEFRPPNDGGRKRRERIIYWKTWTMGFPSRKNLKITVSYHTKFGTDVYNMSVNRVFEKCMPEKEYKAMHHKLMHTNIKYYLATGSHWFGPIGKCRIEVRFDGLTTDNLDVFGWGVKKDWLQFTKDTIVWEFKDYEPKGDVYLSVVPALTRTEILKSLESFRKDQPHDPELIDWLTKYRAVGGDNAGAEKLLFEFLTHWQDEVEFEGVGPKTIDSRRVMRCITNAVITDKSTEGGLNSDVFRIRDAAKFVPVVKRIALRIQSQLAEKQSPEATYYLKEVDKILDWCQEHSNAK